MSNENSSPPSSVPATFVIQASTPATATPAPAAPKGDDDFSRMSSKQFKQRLEEARESGARQLLKELGVEKGDRKEAIKQIKDKQLMLTKREAEVAEAKAQAAALQPVADEASALKSELKAYADEQFAALPEALQKFIAATSTEDPGSRLKAMRAAREAGLVPTSAAAPVTPAATPAATETKAPNPSTTMADSGPPTPKPAGSLDHFEKWKGLVDSGQTIMAALYHQQFGRAIEASRPK